MGLPMIRPTMVPVVLSWHTLGGSGRDYGARVKCSGCRSSARSAANWTESGCTGGSVPRAIRWKVSVPSGRNLRACRTCRRSRNIRTSGGENGSRIGRRWRDSFGRSIERVRRVNWDTGVDRTEGTAA